MTRRAVKVLLILIPIAAAIWFGQRLIGSTTTAFSGDAVSVPTARVTRGPIDLTFYGTGGIGATKTMIISAPVVGSTLRLVKVPVTGDAVKAGDVIMEFDPTEQQYQLEQANLDLAEADQTVAKMRADTQVAESQDQLTLLTAKFDVRRAQMDAVPMPGLIAANDAERRRLSLEEAQRRLVQVQDDVKSRAETTRAQLAVVQERRARTKSIADRAQMAIDSLVIKAPMDGLVVVRENRDLGGEMMMVAGMASPEYRAGDNVSPGRPMADIFDVLQMEIRSRVSESERTNVDVGQSAVVRSHALPGVALNAHVTAIAGLAGRSDNVAAVREFDMTLQLDRPDERVRPGTSVDLVVRGSHLDNALSVPRQAIFEKNGASVVYVRTPAGFETRAVKLLHRTESLAVVADLAEGSEVALVNPEIAAKMAPATSGTPAGPGSK